MNKYYPDRWLVLKLTDSRNVDHFRVFGVWYGGYATGDNWRMNSGIESVEREGDSYIFYGSSGSQYVCHEESYGTSMYGYDAIGSLRRNNPEVTIEELPEDTDFLKLGLSDLNERAEVGSDDRDSVENS